MRVEPAVEEEQLSPVSPRTVTCTSPAPSIFLQGKEEQPDAPEPTATGKCQSKGKPCSCSNTNFDSLLNRWLFHPTPTGEAAPPRLQIKIREIQSKPQLWINRCDFSPLSATQDNLSPRLPSLHDPAPAPTLCHRKTDVSLCSLLTWNHR